MPTLTYASFVFREVEVTPGRWNFLCWEFKWQQYRKWSIWSEGYEVKDMKWRIWSEGYKVKDIKWRVWSEGYEVKDMKWRICNALWPLWSSSSGIYNPTVISRTTSLNIKKILHGAHIVLKCSVWTFALCNINRLVLCNRVWDCFLRGTHRVPIQNRHVSSLKGLMNKSNWLV